MAIKEVCVQVTVTITDDFWVDVDDTEVDTKDQFELENYCVEKIREDNFAKELCKSGYVDGMYDEVIYSICDIQDAEIEE